MNRQQPATMEEAAPAPALDDLQTALDLAAPDMARVDECIRESLRSDVILINQISNYIIAGGGKRLRPTLLVLSARACGYDGDDHVPLAAIVEFIHTATLLHDDVVDESDVRRGKDSAHAVWGNSAAVLVGDFLYSRAFQMMVGVGSMRVMEILAETTNTIAEGEVLQLLNLGDPEISEAAYFRVIRDKTAKLFEAACQLAGVISGMDEKVERALVEYGGRLGGAFQIADDLLDYAGDAGALGKNVGDDLAEGKPTLPLILARSRGTAAQRRLIDDTVRGETAGSLEDVLQIIDETGALELTRRRAQAEAEAALAALEVLPPTEWRRALETLAHHSHRRQA